MSSNLLRNQVIASVVLTVITTIKAMPETLGLTKYKEFLQFYDGTKPLPVDEHTNNILEESLYKIDLDPHMESELDTFVSYGQEIVHKGSLHMKTGAIVGLPIFFGYKEMSDVHKKDLTLKNKSINWESEKGELFAQSLILSDKAKKFAISREIYYTVDNHVTVDCGLLLINMGAAYCGHFALNELYQLKRRLKPFAKLSLVGVIGFLAYGSYSFMSDVYQRRRDHRADLRAAKLGIDFLEGGVEFYNSLLGRNIALYHLLGKDGAKSYTPLGNERISIRIRNLPLTARRDMLKQMLATELSKESSDTTES